MLLNGLGSTATAQWEAVCEIAALVSTADAGRWGHGRGDAGVMDAGRWGQDVTITITVL